MSTIPMSITRLKRPTWKPIVTPGDGTLYDSKFAGQPWLGSRETWPTCQNCGAPLTFLLQLNLEALPEELQGQFGEGLLQLFYCTNAEQGCESECQIFFPFTPGKLVRLIKPEPTAWTGALPSVAQSFPPQHITGWQMNADYPNWEESVSHGVMLSDKEWEELAEQGFPLSGDKLAGWPHWMQSLEYPNCPICHEQMHLIFQVDSNDHLPYMFGDLGCGHITQCLRHPTQVTFAWACS
jgi:uncharacterized protein YwqG